MMSTGPLMSGMGEAILFWVVAAIMVAGALGVLFFKKAAYSAISMVTVMLGLAVMYFMLSAPFMGVVQIVVYTGAIMMLFLFVLMMIGLQASDHYTQQRRSNIIVAAVVGAILAVTLSTIVVMTNLPATMDYTADAHSDEPIEALATTLFSNYWFSMELAAALLITAAIGAVLLTHGDRLTPKRTQKNVVDAKMAAYAASGRHVGQHTAPGVYAGSTAPDVPALSGETLEGVKESVPRVLRVRGLARTIGSLDPELVSNLRDERDGRASDSTDDNVAHMGTAGTQRVTQSQAWGMAGHGAPGGLNQHEVDEASVKEENPQ